MRYLRYFLSAIVVLTLPSLIILHSIYNIFVGISFFKIVNLIFNIPIILLALMSYTWLNDIKRIEWCVFIVNICCLITTSTGGEIITLLVQTPLTVDEFWTILILVFAISFAIWFILICGYILLYLEDVGFLPEIWPSTLLIEDSYGEYLGALINAVNNNDLVFKLYFKDTKLYFIIDAINNFFDEFFNKISHWIRLFILFIIILIILFIILIFILIYIW